MKTFSEFLNEQLKDDIFRNEYDNLQPEFDLIRMTLGEKLSQNYTHGYSAADVELNQSDISK